MYYKLVENLYFVSSKVDFCFTG